MKSEFNLKLFFIISLITVGVAFIVAEEILEFLLFPILIVNAIITDKLS